MIHHYDTTLPHTFNANPSMLCNFADVFRAIHMFPTQQCSFFTCFMNKGWNEMRSKRQLIEITQILLRTLQEKKKKKNRNDND